MRFPVPRLWAFRSRWPGSRCERLAMEVRQSTRYAGRVSRRYAILDDNQRLLEGRLDDLRRVVPTLVADRVCALMVIGSVAEGRARDGSDIDVVVVLREGTPQRSDYGWWDCAVGPRVTASRFPVQPVIVGRQALGTAEPHLRRALETGIVLWDPEGVFRDQPETRP